MFYLHFIKIQEQKYAYIYFENKREIRNDWRNVSAIYSKILLSLVSNMVVVVIECF